MGDSRFVTSAQAAALVGLARTSFYRKRAELRALGFPEPLPWNPRLYLRSAVESWVETCGAGFAVEPDAPPAGANVVVHPRAKQAAARRIAERAKRRAGA